MLFHLIFELPLEVADEFLEIDYLALLHVQFLLDLNFLPIQRAILLGRLSRELVDGLLVVLTLSLELSSDRIEGPAERLHPAAHGLDLVLILPQLPASLGGLFALAFLDCPFVLFELLIRFFFFFF